MHMNVAGMVMPVRVGADNRLMSGEMFLAVGKPQLLCFIYGQAVVRHITRVKADDVVVAFYILPLVVLAVFHIRPYAGECKILIPAIQGFLSAAVRLGGCGGVLRKSGKGFFAALVYPYNGGYPAVKNSLPDILGLAHGEGGATLFKIGSLGFC